MKYILIFQLLIIFIFNVKGQTVLEKEIDNLFQQLPIEKGG